MFEIGRLTRLNLGYTGEANSRPIEICVADWLADWPGAAIGLLLRRPGEDTFYPAKTSVENSVLKYTPTRADVELPGDGLAQIVLTDENDVELRSRVVRTCIEPSLPGSEAEAPEEPMRPFVDQVLEAAARAEAAADEAQTAVEYVAEDAERAVAAADNAEAAAKRAEEAAGMIGPGGGGTGTVTSVNGVQPDDAGNVEIDIPEPPTKLGELEDDAEHRLVSDTEKAAWDAKSNFSGKYEDLSGKPTIPTKLSEMAADATHRLVTDTEKSAWNAKSNFSGKYADLTGKPTIPNVPSWALQSTKPTYTAAEVGALPSTYTPPNQTAAQVGADPAGTAASKVSTHNTDEEAHPAIRQLVSDLSGRLSALADSDDTTLDQLSEIVAYIKSNKSLIDSITTGKVSTADIVNNLTSTATNKPLSAAQGKALKALIDAIVVPTKVSAFENDAGYAKQEELAELSEEIDTLKDSVGAGSSGTNAPAYVIAEAERVANAVMEARTAKSLVLLCASDIHTLESNAQSVETTLHLAQGISEICKRVAVDGIAILGDSAFGSSTSTAEETKVAFTYLRENLAKGENEIWIPGNHDHCGISDESSYLSADELYSYIGANTTDKAVTDYDNLYRMYGYVDYDKQRIRLIYLNTSDITDDYAADYGMSNAQGQWLVDTLSAVQEGWGVVVMSHHPLNGSTVTGLLTIFDAYKGKQSGSVTIGDAISYDFTSAKGEFICHLHGHIHNYQVKTLGTYGILSVTIPNGYFWRNNEYGTGGNSDWGDTDAEGNERVFPKTAGTAEDTAFTAIVIDRGSGTVHALKYGAGIDRTAEFANISGGDEPVVIVVEWKDGYRFSSSSGNQSAQTGMTCAYLPMTDMAVGEGYKVTGITFDNAAHANTYCTAYVNDAYTSEYYALTKGQTNIAFATYYTLSIAEDGSYFEIYKTSAPTDGSTLEVGVAGYGSGANAVVTKVSK